MRLFYSSLFACALGWAAASLQAACSPASASLSFEADDYFYFYINGNAVVAPSGFDPGNPPVTVSVPIGYFNAPGVPNYFAARIRNSAPNLVGGAWVLSINCSDGSTSYITNEDNSYLMYDDINGSAPPPANWFDPAFTDPGSLFTASPVLAPPISWFNPKLTHPLTGAILQMLSHSTSGTQFSDTEDLYFRQTIVLPVYSPTPSPSPTPSFSASPTPYPPGCGTPNFQEAKVLMSGCLGSTGTVTSPNYSFTAQPNQLLVVRICTSSSSANPSAVTFGGAGMTTFAAGSAVGGSNSNRMHTYYLVNPPTSGTVSFSYANANCSWNLATELYNNVDVSNPVSGATAPLGGNASGSSPYPFSFNYTTTGFASLVSMFITSDQIQNSGDKPVATNGSIDMNLLSVGPASVDGGGGEAVAGFYKSVGGAGTYSFDFRLNQANRWWDAQPMEIRGAACATETPTPVQSPTSSATFTLAVTATFTPPLTATRSATPSFTLTRTPTPSISPTPTPTPSCPGMTETFVNKGSLDLDGVTDCTNTFSPPPLGTFKSLTLPAGLYRATLVSNLCVSYNPSGTLFGSGFRCGTEVGGVYNFLGTGFQSPSPPGTASCAAVWTGGGIVYNSGTWDGLMTLSAPGSLWFTVGDSNCSDNSGGIRVVIEEVIRTCPTPVPPAVPTATPEPLLLTPKYPNPSPAKDSVYLPYVLTTAAEVDIRIFDVSGELLLALGPLFQSAGAQERRWDLMNKAGTRVASGVYLCHIVASSPQGETDDAWVKVAVAR